jgi:beta-barrel assembly-enhancing protease
MQGPREGQPVLSSKDFQLFRCIQTEGLEFPTSKPAKQSCSEIHALLSDYRSERYEQALNEFDQLPEAVRQTFSGLDLEIALTLQTGDFDRSREAIETIALFFPSWVQPTIAAVDLAIAEEDARLPRALREKLVQRPERLDLWRALARFAQAFKQDHLLFEARSWDALIHGKLEAAKMQMTTAQEVWPKTADSRPLDLLRNAIKQTEML